MLKDKETGKHIQDYIKMYKENPNFIENQDETSKAITK